MNSFCLNGLQRTPDSFVFFIDATDLDATGLFGLNGPLGRFLTYTLDRMFLHPDEKLFYSFVNFALPFLR